MKRKILSVLMIISLMLAAVPVTNSADVFSSAQAASVSGAVKKAKKVTKITKLTPSVRKVTLKPGETGKVSVKIKPAKAANKKLKWSTSDKKVAAVDSGGLITAKGVGQCEITVKAKDGSDTSAVVLVNVKPTRTLTLYQGMKKEIKPSLPSADTKVKWSVSDAGIASVSRDGVVTARRKGVCYVTAADASGPSEVYGIYRVYVKDGIVEIVNRWEYSEIPPKDPDCTAEEAVANGTIVTRPDENGVMPKLKNGAVLIHGKPGECKETYECTCILRPPAAAVAV